jgi:hypothetical protein
MNHRLTAGLALLAACGAAPRIASADVSVGIPQPGQTYVIPAGDGHVGPVDAAHALALDVVVDGNGVLGNGNIKTGTGTGQRTIFIAVAQKTAANTYLILENHQYNYAWSARQPYTRPPGPYPNSGHEACGGTNSTDYAVVVTVQGGGAILTDVGATYTLPVSNC